jgi:hypothetical protein
MQNVAAIAHVNGVAGVVAALISSDAIEAFGEDVDDLTLSFVAPLNAYDG